MKVKIVMNILKTNIEKSSFIILFVEVSDNVNFFLFVFILKV